MLCTLGASPETIAPRADLAPATRSRWLSGPPPVRTHGRDVELAPGVWIVRHQHWVRPGDLDTAAEIIDAPDADEPVVRRHRYARPPWQYRGLCSRLPLDLSEPLFFGMESLAAPEDLIVAVDTARRVCAQCPVRRECLGYALGEDLRYGVWGGYSGRERRRLRARLVAGDATVEQLVDECLPGSG